MELGVFHECHRPRSYSETDAFDEIFAHAEAAEHHGFDAIWLAEIHFSPTRSVLAAPLVIASALAARTTRLKIGTEVHVLPLSNPTSLTANALLVVPPSVPRSTILPACVHANACHSPAAVVLEPTICPLSSAAMTARRYEGNVSNGELTCTYSSTGEHGDSGAAHRSDSFAHLPAGSRRNSHTYPCDMYPDL